MMSSVMTAVKSEGTTTTGATPQRAGVTAPQEKMLMTKATPVMKTIPVTNMEEIITRVAWKKGGWGRCGRVESKTTIHQTINLKDCTDDCQYHESGKYFWCHTEDGWDYCSSNPDHTYKDVTCRPNHKCGAYGQTYSWCYTTDNDDWDYCGLISTRECKCTPQHRTKRAPPRRQIERRGDQNGRQITFYNEGGQNNFAQSNRRLNDEARNLINQWDQQDLGTQGRTVITSDHLRIDLQGVITRGNQRYYNLQIQINVPRAGRSTTLSQIIVPFGTSAANMRWAFNYSLTNGVRVAGEFT
ncbi:uncharacterized protein LOC108882527 [Lates calcarifer]|uniref:Uncharacterized protein LOC108882527 n=1 Tax=Lates calcarifer TaxID=8187 RepID=A0AAJ7LRW9_LATCA|nr:uncharacterized protein LOC108882527 [Lates calcarifer]XP_018530579.1 uncharacterized protein LOC108882527 [Lates calcarifer]XP_018530580.1 uncharacterized protein LOC108882527 [Lates calcarifer]XP_018530581.1 uncharacterized protein LOC108882527 [Lates calcarifer]